MALNYVTLTVDIFDGSGNIPAQGSASFVPSAVLTDGADRELVAQIPVTVPFRPGVSPVVRLLATDNAAVLPAGWAWQVSFSGDGFPSPFSFFLPFASGAAQNLSAQAPVSPVTTMQAYLPLPSGTAVPGAVPTATGSGEASAWTVPAGTGTVTSVAAGDASIVVSGTPAVAPVLETGTLDAIASLHPPAANVPLNAKKITGLANGSAASDAAAFGQTPAGGATVTIAQGGTGQVSQQAAVNALTGLQSAGKVLRSDGTNAALASLQAGDLPAATGAAQGAVQLAGDLGGTAASPQVTGTHLASPLPLLQGGTGQATQQAALDALAGAQTNAQYLRGNGTHVLLSAVQAADLPTLDLIPAPAAPVGLNGKKITSLANGSAATDAAAFGQIPLADATASDIAQVSTAAAAGAIGKWADAGHVHADPNPLPADFGWTAWTFDPFGTGSSGLLASGTIYLVAFWLRKVTTISNIIIHVTTAGSTLTAGQSFAGIYDSAGTRQGVTADQSSLWTSGGIKTMALTTAFTNAPAGMYWAAFVSNGTTPPTLRTGAAISSTFLANAGLAAGSLRIATNGTGTALPATLVPGSNVQTSSAPIIAILS